MDKFAALFARTGLTLERLRALCLLAESGSLTSAAGHDPAKLSLFSRQIKELEAFFETRLARRRGKRLILTEEGRALSQLAQKQFIELAEFARQCAGRPAEVSIGGGASVMESLLMPRLPELRQSLRGARVTLVRAPSESLASRLRDLQLDLAVIRENSVVPPLQAEFLMEFNYALFVPRAMAGAPSRLRSWLPELPMIAPADGWTRQRFDEAAANADLKLTVVVEGSSAALAIAGVRNGDYAAILPDTAQKEFAPGETVMLRPRFLQAIRRRLIVAWNPRMTEARPIVARAVDVLLERKAAIDVKTAPPMA